MRKQLIYNFQFVPSNIQILQTYFFVTLMENSLRWNILAIYDNTNFELQFIIGFTNINVSTSKPFTVEYVSKIYNDSPNYLGFTKFNSIERNILRLTTLLKTVVDNEEICLGTHLYEKIVDKLIEREFIQ